MLMSQVGSVREVVCA